MFPPFDYGTGLPAMAFDFSVPMFAAVDFWMTRWLTPIWFLGGGVILGLLVLTVFLVVFYSLSMVKQLEKLRRDGSAHFLALAVTLVLLVTGLIYFRSAERTFADVI